MMVSTRGVKFKFTEGERVLCYEPDPTKAKVLYESKVLQLVVSRDSRGRKIPEYLVHFYGWNSSWDRCVAEDFILPDNDENRILQMRLSQEAAIQLKGKKKHKMNSLLKGSFNPCKKPNFERERKDFLSLLHTDNDPSVKDSDSSNDDDDDKGEHEGEVDDVTQDDDADEGELDEDDNDLDFKIEIPDSLKDVLEDDCFMVTCKNKLVNLPCEPSVVSILEGYVKSVAVGYVCAAPLKDTRQHFTINQVLPTDFEMKLMFCKEVVDGLRIYFDFCLPALLLYKQEQTQYGNISTIKVSSPLAASELKKPVDDAQEPKPMEVSEESQESPVSPTAHTPTSPRTTRQTRAATCPLSPVPTTSTKTATQQYRKGSQSPPATASCSVGEDSQPTKRILRSSDKLKFVIESKVDHPPKEQAESELACHPTSGPESPPLPQKILRHTLKSLSPTPMTTETVQKSLTVAPSRPTPIPQTPSSVQAVSQNSVSSVGSSASSTHSSVVSSVNGTAPRVRDTSGLLNEVLSWQMLPPHLYEQCPPLPSMIYGAHHLLRLFVKLPSFIQKMNIPTNKRECLQKELQSFLRYLQEKREEFFADSVYNKEQTNFG